MTKSLTSRRKEKYLFCCTFLFVLTLFVSVQNSMCTRNDTSNCFPPPNQGEVHQIEGSFTQLRGPSHNWEVLHTIEGSFTQLRGPSHNWGVLHTIERSFTQLRGPSHTRGELHQIEGNFIKLRDLHQIKGSFTKSRGPSPNQGVLHQIEGFNARGSYVLLNKQQIEPFHINPSCFLLYFSAIVI